MNFLTRIRLLFSNLFLGAGGVDAMLSVAELRQRKQQLEQAIADLIHNFEHETSVEVDNLLTVERNAGAEAAQEQQVARIKVDIHLNM